MVIYRFTNLLIYYNSPTLTSRAINEEKTNTNFH